jgi:hypothetical protein
LKFLGNSFCPTDLSAATASYLAPGSSTAASIALTKDANGDYVGDLPAQAANTVGQYSVTATFANGKSYVFPDNAADPNYQTYVGDVQNLYCTNFDDTTAPADWTHGGTPADEWEWGAPGEIAGTNDPRVAFSGPNVSGEWHELFAKPGHQHGWDERRSSSIPPTTQRGVERERSGEHLRQRRESVEQRRYG